MLLYHKVTTVWHLAICFAVVLVAESLHSHDKTRPERQSFTLCMVVAFCSTLLTLQYGGTRNKTILTRLPSERPHWWNTTEWETTLMKDYWVRDYPVRPPWWKTTSETTLMKYYRVKDYPVRDHPDERLPHKWPPWWDYPISDHPDERLPSERPPWWKTINATILMKDYPISDHPDETTPWVTTLMRDYPTF